MKETNDLCFLFYFFTSLLGIIVSLLLWFFNKNKTLLPRLLAAYLFLLSIIALYTELYFTRFFIVFPHFWRNVGWATFLAPVVAYLYVRSVLEQAFSLRKKDYFLLIPSIIYTFCSIPFFLHSKTEKIAIITKLLANKVMIAREPEIYLPQSVGMTARLFWGLILVMAQFRLLYLYSRKIKSNPSLETNQNKSILNWLFLFTAVIFSFYILLSLHYAALFTLWQDLTVTICFVFSATILFICMYLLAKPNILYGLTGWIQFSESFLVISEVESKNPEEVARKTSFTYEQGITIKKALENHLTGQQPFLKNGYTLNNLSNELDIREYQLSAFINQNYGKNFNELINEYRVNYFISLLESPNNQSQFTIEAMGKMSGFNSKRVLIAAVKKFSGKLPSELLAEKK